MQKNLVEASSKKRYVKAQVCAVEDVKVENLLTAGSPKPPKEDDDQHRGTSMLTYFTSGGSMFSGI